MTRPIPSIRNTQEQSLRSLSAMFARLGEQTGRSFYGAAAASLTADAEMVRCGFDLADLNEERSR